MSRGERKAMMRRDHPALSLSRQCKVLSDQPVVFLLRAQGGEPGELGPDAPHR